MPESEYYKDLLDDLQSTALDALDPNADDEAVKSFVRTLALAFVDGLESLNRIASGTEI